MMRLTRTFGIAGNLRRAAARGLRGPARRHRMSRGRPGVAHTQRVIDKALRLHRSGKWSFRSIAHQCGGRSHKTISQWTQQKMTPTARRLRSAMKGGPKLLTEGQERVAIGCSSSETTSISTHEWSVSSNSARLVGRAPAKSWVSKFLKHHSMSSRIVQPTAPELVNRRAYRQGVEFLRALQASGKQPSQVLFADKISFSIPHRTVRMIAPKGAGTPHHPLRSGGPPIYVYSSSVGDDSMGPFYARH